MSQIKNNIKYAKSKVNFDRYYKVKHLKSRFEKKKLLIQVKKLNHSTKHLFRTNKMCIENSFYIE